MSARNGDKARFNREQETEDRSTETYPRTARVHSKGTHARGNHSPRTAKVGVGMNASLLGLQHGSDLGGRTLTINEAKPRAERPRGGSVFAVQAAVDATTIVVIRGSRANRAGSLFERQTTFGRADNPCRR